MKKRTVSEALKFREETAERKKPKTDPLQQLAEDKIKHSQDLIEKNLRNFTERMFQERFFRFF